MSSTALAETTARVGAIETHSIGFIPESERKGKPWHLFTLWFGGNSVIVSVVTGAILVGSGMSFAWSVAAIVIGFGLGSFLSAFHSAQGPQLGIPQMIQSRAQFGYYGGIIPMVIAVLNYLVFFAAAPAICGLLLNALWGWNVYVVAVVVTAMTFVLALYGYDLAHRVGKYLSVAAIVVFGIFTVLLFTHTGIPAPTFENLDGDFQLGLFLTGVAITFIYAAGYSPYIADYSRYLPKAASPAATMWWTYAGIAISGIWLFVLGAYLTSVTGFNLDTLGSVLHISNTFSPVFTGAFVIVILLIQVLQGSLSMYAGGNTAVSIAATLSRIPDAKLSSLRVRLAGLVPFALLCLAATIAYSASFHDAFTAALGVILILLIPWSAINLVDFYFIRSGHYDVKAIFDPAGRYGKYNAAGLVSFFVGFVVELLFVNLGYYVGPFAGALDGGDLSWLIGIVVSGGCYYFMAKKKQDPIVSGQ